jgi:hypothetical protein
MYVSGEIAGNILPRSEPVMTPLVKSFMRIHEKIGERFSDDNTFLDELKKLSLLMAKERNAAGSQQLEQLEHLLCLNAPNSRELLSEPVLDPVLDEEATLPEQLAPQHKPHHDVESVFWALVCCLVRALPDDADDNPTEPSDRIFNDMLYHEMPSSRSNRRDEALGWTQKEWEEALHPRLRMLGLMVVRMCELLCIHWRDRSTESNSFLLHQGFKRLLLMQILEIGENDIRLNTDRPRTIYAHWPEDVRSTVVDSSLRASGRDSSQQFETHQIQRPKRGVDSIRDPGEATSSRKKPKFSHPAQVPQSTPQDIPYHPLFDGPLSPSPSEVDAHDMEMGSLPTEGPMQQGTEGTADDEGEIMCEKRSQEDVDKLARERVAEELRQTIVDHRRRAESLVKIHLDDEAWHQVTVKPDDVFK